MTGGRSSDRADRQIRKDCVLGLDERLACHQMITDAQETLEGYMRSCHQVMDVLFEHLEKNLGLEKGTLLEMHRLNERSGDHIRFTRAPAQPFNEVIAKQGEHTDFGSLTILFNWLGGLQIRRPDDGKWVYVKPVPGNPIVNLGDAMVTFTGGILRSNIHRVVPPPAPQDGMDRSSLVFFRRPENSVILRRLKGGLIDAQPATQDGPEMTAEEWWMARGTGKMPGIFTKNGFEPFVGGDLYAGQTAKFSQANTPPVAAN